MKLVLGIDQGSSHTRALLSTLDGCLVGYGRSRGAYHLFDGMQATMQAVKDAAQIALAQSGAAAGDIVQIYGGFTGADWPDEYDLLTHSVRHLDLGPASAAVHITNDTLVALRGGTEQSYGAILIAGSGGNCGVRAPDGREYLYAYYHPNDLQGGGALGHQALDAISRSFTGLRPPTSLTQRVLEFYKVSSIDDLTRGLIENKLSSERIKELAPFVFEEAYQGDAAAASILEAFGKGCADLVINGLRRFDMLHLDVEVVLSGSIFKGVGSLLTETLTAQLHKSAPKARLIHARYEPVVGSVLLGLEKQSVQIDSPVKANIERTARELHMIRLDGIDSSGFRKSRR
jgi:N-acetylglucosamine kinase-like BadF-type ATPase